MLNIPNSALILTSNRALNDYLSQNKKYNVIQIYDWIKIIFNQYVSNLSKDHEDSCIFLKETPTQLLWQQILENHFQKNNHDDELFTNLSIYSATTQAIDAYQLLIQWRIHSDYFNQNKMYIHSETEHFLLWQNEFNKICDKNNWLVVYKMSDKVAEWIDQGKIKCPKIIYYSGFEAIVPQIQYLFDILTKNGISLKSLDNLGDSNNIKNSSKNYFKFSDSKSEFFSVANWASECLKKFEYKNHQKNSYPIGIIIDDLSTHHDDLKQIFEQVLENKNAYNIAVGKSLDEFELIQQAIFLMSLYPHKILNLSEINYLILNIHQQDQFDQRILFESHLRKNKIKTRYKLEELYQILSNLHQNEQTIASDFKLMLEKFFEHYDNSRCGKKHSPSEWVDYFKTILNIFDWNNLVHAQSEEFKSQWNLEEKISNIFNKFIEISVIFPLISLKDALSLLKRLMQEYSLRPENNKAPIQIVSLMESQSIQFDYLWLMNAHSQNYPSSPKPNSFLPIELQKEYKMPRATSENQFEFSSKLIDNLLKNTQIELNISYAEYFNNQQNNASTLLLDKINYSISDVKRYSENFNYLSYLKSFKKFYQNNGLDQNFIEWKSEEFYTIDNKGSEVIAIQLKSGRIKGGTGIFKAQASCPFKAYASFRLELKEFNLPEEGLPKFESGTLVHSVLEYIWRKIKTSENLKNMMLDDSKTVFNQLFKDSFDYALIDKNSPTKAKKQGEIYKLEYTRIYKLIYKWLQFETNRNGFFEIESLEQRENFQNFFGFDFTIVIDRIDKLINVNKDNILDQNVENQYVIIDYKTGSANSAKTKNWETPRILEPQMPIYAVKKYQENKKIAGITFAKINSKEMGFSGLFDQSIIEQKSFPKITKKYQANLEKQIQDRKSVV